MIFRLGLLLGLCCVVVWGSGCGSTEDLSETEKIVPVLLNWKWRLREAKAIAWYFKYFAGFQCDVNCTIDTSEWNPTTNVCTSDGNLISNPFCSSTQIYADCKSGEFKRNPEGEYSIVTPSSCICPSDCSDRGNCVFDGCSCHDGYSGEDCKTIDCTTGQDCHGRGTCEYMDDLEISTCECEQGFATNDCSAELKELPPIPNLLDVDQYTSWDKYGDESPIFNESTIAQIYITVDPQDLSDLILPSNQDARVYKHANFSFYNGAVSERMEDVGFRIKGGASREYAKKSWKISFSHFVDDRKWAQQKKISLKGAGMDPLYVRERASLASIRAMGGPVQRSSHATLYVNGQYWGLYILLEEAGSNQFLKSRFGNDDGSLWKITGGNTLKYDGSDEEAYRNNTKFVAMNDGAEDSYAPLINFIDILNNCPDDQFEAQIQTVMDIEFFLRTLSSEVSTANWDGVYNGNNYYLYYNTDSLFYYYRYDVDLSMGSIEEWFQGANRDVWNWGKAGFGHRLIQRVLRVPSFQAIYSTYLLKAISYTKWTSGGDFTKRMEYIHSEVTSAAKDDKWHSLDNFAYSYNEFLNNLHTPILRPNVFPPQNVFKGPKMIVYTGVSDFLKTRVATIKEQVKQGPPE